jgi:tRNA(Ile)-lysidine synthase
MFRHGDAVLAGVSGGADSVALLHVLIAVAPEFSLRIGIAHLNHCLRGEESDRDAEFVRSLAKQLNLPYYIKSADVQAYRRIRGLSAEEAGRELRYAFYERIAAEYGYDKIASAHHADDNAELVLMYLLRGAGPSGLSGIPPVRGNRIVRPLIEVRKSELRDFLTGKGLKWISDSSNEDKKFLRNRIRHDLLPLLISDYNPKIVESLNRTALILKSEDEWMDARILELSEACISDTAEEKILLTVPDTLCIAVIRRLIRKAIARIKGNLRRISCSHLEAVSELLQKGGSLDLPEGIRAERIGKRLVFSKIGHRQLPDVKPDFEYILREPGTVFIKETGARVIIAQADMNFRLGENPCIAFLTEKQ